MVGITPTGFISFLPSCYGGQTSDKFITRDSGFYDLLLERVDEVITGMDFQIQEVLLLLFLQIGCSTTRKKKKKKNKV